MKALKTIHILSFSLAILTLPQPGLAQMEAEDQAAPGKHRESRMLMHLLEMEDAELAKLRQTVERIEAMSPEERAKMRERLGKLQKMAPERRKALRERFEAIPKEKREAMRQRWMDMSPEKRREWRQKLRGMSPEERADAMEEAGFFVPGPGGRKRDGEGPPHERKGPRFERMGPPPPLE